ncbi:MAG: Rieske 2Fe-2S domain-containing protein [Spirosoma sp.]|nr:Rieske 2Fe-2S domain-containing protein [Spirosoma sp.]
MENQSTTDQLKRGEFIRSLGLSSAALMAFYCMGTLTSCSSKNDPAPVAPTPPTTTPPTTATGLTGNTETAKGAINFTVDLTSNNYKALKTAGEFVKIGDVLVANTSGGFVAVQRLCTHNSLDGLSYRLNSNDIGCNVHGSVFATSGTVKNGPAASALRVYTTALSTDGNKLTITA